MTKGAGSRTEALPPRTETEPAGVVGSSRRGESVAVAERSVTGPTQSTVEREASVYLRELNQRLVYRLVNQVEELKRLNQHFIRRATQLADLHRAVQDITSEMGARAGVTKVGLGA